MRRIYCLETSVDNDQLKARNIPEERRAHLYRGQYQYRPRTQPVLLYKVRECNGTQAPRCAAVTVGVACRLFSAVANCSGALLSKKTPETAQMWDDWSTVSEKAQRIDTE